MSSEKLLLCLKLLEPYRVFGVTHEAVSKRFNASDLLIIDLLLVYRFMELPKEFYELEGQELLNCIFAFVENGKIKGSSLNDTGKSSA